MGAMRPASAMRCGLDLRKTRDDIPNTVRMKPRSSTRPKPVSQCRYGLRGPTRAVLSLVLALCCGALPIATFSHLSTSDHVHRYCAEHDQVEEIEVETAAWAAGDEGGALPAALPAGPLTEGNSAHLACPILNQAVSRTLPLEQGAVTFVEPLLVSARRGNWRCPLFLACPLLRAAPKTSPPHAAV